MGTYKRDGVWYYDFRLDGQRYVTRVGPKKSEALAAERQARRGVTRKVPVLTPKTVEEAVTSYLEVGTSHWAPGTRRSVASVLGIFRASLGDVKLADVGRNHLEGYRGSRSAKVSANQVRREFAVLRAFFRDAVSRKLLAENPVPGIPLPRAEAGPDRVLTEAEEQRLLEAVERPVLRDMIRFLLLTGLRRQEVCGLTWQDVDLGNACLTLAQKKTGRIKRLPLVGEAVELLRGAFRSLSGASVYVSGEIARFPSSPIFLNGRGVAFHPSTFWLAFHRACTKAGIADLRPHDLRHTLATRLIRNGCDVPTVGAILGHAPPYRETMRYFAHTSEERMRKALEAMSG